MNDAISPFTSRLLAIGVLLLTIWLGSNVAIRTISARISASDEVGRLQELATELESRRVDIPSLERQLAAMMSAPSVKGAVIVAETDRAALAQLQQFVRSSLERAQGKLLSISEASSAQDQSIVGVQVRARIRESSVSEWLSAVEIGELRLQVDNISLANRSEEVTAIAEIDLSAVLQARWIRRERKVNEPG